mmetsp:Transcript_21908/g.32563  ORF Transcript_21908/g.32563 Transcript_21908/m.32563 type:complete len:386 (-) Transcript_21908:77-1234(-)
MSANTSSNPAGKYYGFHHCEFLVGNALQASSFYTSRLGFKKVAYRGLETGSRDVCTHVVAQNDVKFAFTSVLNTSDANKHLADIYAKSGDGVLCVAFSVSDTERIYKRAIERGAVSVSEPKKVEATGDGAKGHVILATIRTYGDTVHTFVQQSDDYNGVFLPGYQALQVDDPLEKITGPVDLQFIDHIVGNQPDKQMEPVASWYEKMLDFHRFWSIDDSMIHTEYSSLRSIVMTDVDEKVKMPINEPAAGKRKSQIQEYVDYYGGAGVQHIALNTNDIIDSVTKLRQRGVPFLAVPDSYYEQLREKLKSSPITIKEDLDTLQKLKILVDHDEKGYLLQLFTKPLEDRPTLFIEIIQRHNHQGFGAGNFKSLFEAIEREQEKRGNL